MEGMEPTIVFFAILAGLALIPISIAINEETEEDR